VRKIQLYASTMAGLRPIQWLYLPLRRLQATLPGRVGQSKASLGTSHLDPTVRRLGVDRAASVVSRAEAIVRRDFTFLGRTKRLEEIDWRRRYGSHLWNYNLHYFEYALDLAWAYEQTGDGRFAIAFQELAISWVRGTEPGRGDGWEPYPVSVRIVNWLMALAILGDVVPEKTRRLLAGSLARQASWLERRLEKHLQGNHLQKNYLALAIAGLFLDGDDAARWRRLGLQGSWAALREQVLEDGIQFERSPMYHAIALADFLLLLALCEQVGEKAPAGVRQRIRRMADAYGGLCRPDGSLHLFNDAANGVALSRDHLDRLVADVLGDGIECPVGPFQFPSAGYFGYADPGSGVRLLIDCGVPGPRYQPGHAHCDLLSFELDVAGRPVVVDSGVSGYDGDPLREYVRSTRAHNTIIMGNREQSEVWGTFRVARMAFVRRAHHDLSAREYRFEGAYSPYHRRRWEHARQINVRERSLLVSDRLRASAGVEVRSYVHLHPRFHIRKVGGREVLADSADGDEVRLEAHGVDHIRVGRGAGHPEGWYCPSFGQAEPAAVIEMVSSVGPGSTLNLGYAIFHR
jgi:uncharacterized heparinase superfamily protein